MWVHAPDTHLDYSIKLQNIERVIVTLIVTLIPVNSYPYEYGDRLLSGSPFSSYVIRS